MDKKIIAQNVQYVVSASDLKEIVATMLAELRSGSSAPDAPVEALSASDELLSAHEVAAKLKVTRSTLWRWAKMGFLVPLKAGAKVLYRESDVMSALERRKAL